MKMVEGREDKMTGREEEDGKEEWKHKEEIYKMVLQEGLMFKKEDEIN